MRAYVSRVAASDLLVLVRHARPEVDPSVPAASWTLGAEGLAGAARLAERLRAAGGLGLDLVVSSIEPKAVGTAQVIAAALDLSWQTGHDLHEHDRSGTGYLPAEDFAAAMQRFFSRPDEVVLGTESATAAFTRFSRAVDALVKVHTGKRLCVVAHGTVMSLLLGGRYGVDAFATWQALGTPAYVVVDRRSRLVVEVVRSV